MLEQPFDDADRTLGFHPQNRLTQTGGGRRTKQTRPLETRLRMRGDVTSARSTTSANMRRASSRFAGVIAWCPAACHCPEERLEHLVDELTLPPRVHHLFVFRLLLETQHVLRKELERAVEIRFERADRPAARRLWTETAVERGIITARPEGRAYDPR